MLSPTVVSTTCWILRLALTGQCLGVAIQLLLGTFESEADVYGFLFFDRNWPEATALAIENAGTWAYLVAGGLVVLVPLAVAASGHRQGRVYNSGVAIQVAALVWIALWQATLTSLHAWRGGSFMAEWAVGAHAVRIVSPLALALLLTVRMEERASNRLLTAEWLLRVAVAATFAVHGLEAWWLHSNFIDLLINSSDNLLGVTVAESATLPVLRAIGVVDLAVALLIVLVRSRTLAAYMSFWGFLTACSRITAGGLAGLPLSYDDTLIRLANGAAPLALLALWIGLHGSKMTYVANPSESTSLQGTSHAPRSEYV